MAQFSSLKLILYRGPVLRVQPVAICGLTETLRHPPDPRAGVQPVVTLLPDKTMDAADQHRGASTSGKAVREGFLESHRVVD